MQTSHFIGGFVRVFKRLFFVFCLLPVCAMADLSDRLPSKLVEAMIKNKTWSSHFDDDSHPETIDVGTFLRLISNPGTGPSEVIQNIFSNKNTKVMLSATYPVKTQILRYYSDYLNSPYIEKVKRAWIAEYTNSILALIKVIGGNEFSPYVNTFENLVTKKEIIVEDLSLGLRQELVKNSHGHSQNLLDTDNVGNYTISGVYSKERRVFAIDLARRSLEETIVTFVHEMIHAGDAEVVSHERRVVSLLPEVLKIISQKTQSGKHLSFLSFDDLRQFFYEGDISKINELLRDETPEVRRVRKLDFSSKEEESIRNWLRSLIRTTVLNEYHAYGLSLKFLYKLNNEIDLVFGNVSSYNKIIEKFRGGDHIFINELGYFMNPFQGMKSLILRSKKSPLEKSTLAQISSDLEDLYIQELRNASEKNKGYATFIKSIALKERKRGQVQPWMDDLSLPTSPYQILTAKITTAWIYRFKENINLVNDYFHEQNSSLLLLTTGVLDLHDVNQGELKLIGVQWEESKFQNIDDEVAESVKRDLDLIPEEIKNYFDLYRWTPAVLEDHKENGFISAEAVTTNLLRLKLLKLSVWFDNNFEAWKHSLIGAKTFVEKLRSGITVNPEEIDEKRSQELEDELIEILKTGDITKDEIVNLEDMLKSLLTLYKAAEDIKWAEVSRTTLEKIRFIERVLEGIGVYGSKEEFEARDDLKEEKEKFLSQLSPYLRDCKRKNDFYNYKGVGQFDTNEAFLVNAQKFKLMLTCNDGELYAVRQPGDFTRYMTLSFSSDKRLSAKIFKGSRKIILSPVKQGEVAKKKKGFFGLF